MRITSAELDQLAQKWARRAHPQSVCGPTSAHVFIPGALINPLNASSWIWQKRKRWTDAWHDKTAAALWEAGYRRGQWDPKVPKRITYVAHVRRKFDALVNLPACLKPIEDALVKCDVIHTDAPDSGHFFAAHQVLDRVWRGVEITVECV